MRSTPRLFTFAALTLALALAAPAQAQRGGDRHHHGRDHDDDHRGHGHHGHRPVLQVTGYSPATGTPGTRITINGSGFSPQSTVYFGGRPVRLESVQPHAITFVVPPRHGGGPIVLRHPGVADIHVGAFTIAYEPRIRSVTAGPRRIGTRIDITGEHFAPGDLVELGGISLPIVRLTPTRITANLPPGVSTGRLTLVRPSTGRRYDSGVVVTIEAPPPVLTGIHPASGAPGTRVRVSVTNLDPSVRVFYGRTALPAVATGPNYIDVVIPGNARSSDVITLRHRRGTSAGQRFELVFPLAIHSVTAGPGRGGVQLTITGTGFTPGVQVSVGNIAGRIVSVTPTRITAIVPPSVPISAPVVVQAGGQSAASPRPLQAYRR